MGQTQVQQFGVEYLLLPVPQPVNGSVNILGAASTGETLTRVISGVVASYAVSQSNSSGAVTLGSAINIFGVGATNNTFAGSLVGTVNLAGVGNTLPITPKSANNSCTLFIAGQPPTTNSLNMSVCCATHTISGTPYVPLSMAGNSAGASGMVRSMSLYIRGTAYWQSVNLFLQGAVVGKAVQNINLFTTGVSILVGSGRGGGSVIIPPPSSVVTSIPPNGMDYWVAGLPFGGLNKPSSDLGTMRYWSQGLPGEWLFKIPIVSIAATGIYNTIPLTIIGKALVPSGIPLVGSMNLFIKRWPTNMVPLFVACASPVSSIIPMYIKGQTLATNTVPLAIPVTKGIQTSNTPLFVSGY